MNFHTIKRNRKWRSECGQFVIERSQEFEGASHMYVASRGDRKIAIRSFLSEAKRACVMHKAAA